MKYCPDCGCENIDEAQFCRNCGLKFTAAVKKTSQDVVKANKTTDDEVNSIIKTLFYKTDKYTGDLRIAKAKTVSVVVFIIMFIFCVFVNIEGASLIILFLASTIFGLLFAIPTYVLGFVVGMIVDRMSH